MLPGGAGDRLLLTLWVGGLWAVGYLVAPTLFATLADRQLAGQIAGQLFHLMSLIGLVCGGLLLVGAALRNGVAALREWRVGVVGLMLVVTLIGSYVLQPQMAALKLEGIAEGSAAAAQFGRLHGISSGLWMLNSLLGLALVVAAGPFRARRGG